MKYRKEDKLHILDEAKRNGVKVTLSKNGLSAGTFYHWRRKFTVHGEEGLSHRLVKNQEEIARKLEKENQALRILLAKKELESRMKDELLKKMYPELNKSADKRE